MKPLDILLKSLKKYEIVGGATLKISGILFDSRKVTEQGDAALSQLYVAQRGTQNDGHKYLNDVISKGCKAVVCEQLPETIVKDVTYIKVKDSSKALGMLSSAFYDHPSKKLKLVGITGTNGKTTTVTLLYNLFKAAGYKCGLISTIVYRIGNNAYPSTHTTPDAVTLNSFLSQMVEQGCEYCFMEVSSHSIVQHRITGLHFSGGIFSNITHDHLDFHKTFTNYIAAKKLFFDALPRTAFALTNIDDKNGKVMVQNCKARVYTYSLKRAANFKGAIMENAFSGLQMRIQNREVFFMLCGKFNAYNLLAIYGAAMLLGMEEDTALMLMSGLESANGRFNKIAIPNGATAIVDYAHTPDALQNVLVTIRDISGKDAEVITVVGCGGDRDALKRPEMAAIACKYSDKVVLTSDNPRTEDPNAILNDMVAGVPKSKSSRVIVIEDRHAAIKTACMMLQPNSVLLIAGKGHETYQEVNHVRHHFDDTEEVKKNFEIK